MNDTWNFSYGANMNPKVLSKRRGIDPLESLAGCLKDYRLVFNLRGFPWVEPVFANIEPDQGSSVHGVLHRLTPEQFHRLDLFEGGGRAYKHLELDVEAYDGRTIQAHVYSARMITDEGSPSCRYLNLLNEGARHFGLDPDYIKMLEDHPCCGPSNAPDFVVRGLEGMMNMGVSVMSVLEAAWSLKKRISIFKRR